MEKNFIHFSTFCALMADDWPYQVVMFEPVWCISKLGLGYSKKNCNDPA